MNTQSHATSSTTSAHNPFSDPERLMAIANLGLLSDEAQELLQDLTERASKRLNLPISLVSIVIDTAQYFAAHTGLEGTWMAQARGTPIEWSFCRFVVAEEEPFVVNNAAVEPAVADNPLVTQDGIRCYAGVPLITSEGHILGSFCVIGPEERTFEQEELDFLKNLAKEAVQRLEGRVCMGQDI